MRWSLYVPVHADRALTWLALLATLLGGAAAALAQTTPSPSTVLLDEANPVAPEVIESWETPPPYPVERIWGSGEYLFGWIQSTDLPPLVTTSPAGTPRDSAGVIGAPGTQVLLDGSVNGELRPGFRLALGGWLDPERILGVEAGFTFLGGLSDSFSAVSDGSAILARPFRDAQSGTREAVLIAFPGSSAGGLDIVANSSDFYQVHVDLIENFCDLGWARVNALLGWRFFRYDDRLFIQQGIRPSGPSFQPGTRISTFDDFGAQNEFHGADFGVRSQFFWQGYSLELSAIITVGGIQQRVSILGGQRVLVPGDDPAVELGGVYALGSNMGTHINSDWALVPSAGITLSRQLGDCLTLRLGYSLMILDEISRAADQIDQTLNPNLFPPATNPAGPLRPEFVPQFTDIWVQSLSIGVQLTY